MRKPGHIQARAEGRVDLSHKGSQRSRRLGRKVVSLDCRRFVKGETSRSCGHTRTCATSEVQRVDVDELAAFRATPPEWQAEPLHARRASPADPRQRNRSGLQLAELTKRTGGHSPGVGSLRTSSFASYEQRLTRCESCTGESRPGPTKGGTLPEEKSFTGLTCDSRVGG